MFIRFLKLGGRILLACAIFLVAVWCTLALWNHPWTPLWLGAATAVGYAAAVVFLFWKYEFRRAIGAFAAVSLFVLLLAILPRPTHNRAWAAAQAVMPLAEFDGDDVTIGNMRRTVYLADGGYEIEHYDATFDLTQLDSVWFGVQHFSQWKSLAHTFVSFGFADGRFLAISIESRRGENQRFSAVGGMFRNYGMIYVMGDELEVIGRRSVESEDPIYLYPIRADQQQMKAMLIDMLERANQLAQRPEFYDTWTNNCTNNIVRHFNKVAPKTIWPYSVRIAFPGHTGRVAYEHGLIDSDEPFEAIQDRAMINGLAREAKRPDNFSAMIRENFVD